MIFELSAQIEVEKSHLTLGEAGLIIKIWKNDKLRHPRGFCCTLTVLINTEVAFALHTRRFGFESQQSRIF